jgi:O-antigen/teichoic acid export membrane protein
VLARLLSPADFGVMALVSFFTGFGVAVIENGFATALIQRQETSREQESALFWMGLAWAGALALLLVLIGPLVADFYDQPLLEPLMWLAGTHVILVALGSVPMALMSRALRFDVLAKISLSAAIISGCAAIGAAALGAGPWALGVQLIVFTGLQAVLLWRNSRWSPLARIRGTGARQLLGFSQRVGFSSLVDHLYVQGFTVLVGKLYGLTAVGLYNRANATQYFASGALGMLIRRFALPLFSSRAADPELLRQTMRKSVQLATLITLPVMAGLAVASDLVILILFGPVWLPAAPILSVLAIAGFFWPMQVINMQLLLAIDRPDLYWRTELLKKSVGIALILIGSAFGLLALAWSQVLFAVFAHFFNGYFSGKHAGYGAWRQLGDVLGAAVVCAVGVAAVLAIRPALDLPPFFLLATLGIIGTSIFGILGFLLRVGGFREAEQMLRGALGKRT